MLPPFDLNVLVLFLVKTKRDALINGIIWYIFSYLKASYYCYSCNYALPSAQPTHVNILLNLDNDLFIPKSSPLDIAAHCNHCLLLFSMSLLYIAARLIMQYCNIALFYGMKRVLEILSSIFFCVISS